jgi:CRISPR system Cascade subunit CasB
MSAPPEGLRRVGDIVAAIAAQLGNPVLGTGPLATLRRLDPRVAPAEPALLRLLVRELPEGWLHRDIMHDWTLVIHCLALAAPDQHRGGPPLGAALQAAGYSETRLLRLLKAGQSELAVLLPRACRFLVAKGERLNPGEIARFVLAVRRAETDRDAAELARTRIAREYYQAERRAVA